MSIFQIWNKVWKTSEKWGFLAFFKTIIVTKVKKVSKKVVTMKKNLSFGKRI